MEKTPPAAGPVTPPATSPAPNRAAPARRLTRRARLLLAGVVVIVGAALAIPRLPLTPPLTTPADRGPARVEPVVDLAQVPAAHAATPALVASTPAPTTVAVVEPTKKTAAPKAAKDQRAPSPKSAAHVSAAPVTHPAYSASAAAKPASEPAAASALASTAVGNVGPPPVTITGCLEVSVNADEFRLTDTQGFDAPKSRSWKSGFIKKRSAPVMLVELTNAHALQTQVGKRVAATGHLASNELTVSSVRVVSPSCD
jgi:hypothetical protein